MGDQQLGRLITKEFSQWKDAIEVFKVHAQTKYHINSVHSYLNLEKIMENDGRNPQAVSIITKINSSKRAEVEKNRKIIDPVIRTVILCGRQGIPLRGHRESHGNFSFDDPVQNDGNFLSILRFGLNLGENEQLRDIRANCAKNATYVSSEIQNEIIENCGAVIQRKIISEIQKSKYFSILADETTDVGNIEQFSLCVRYVDEENFRIVERFLNFVPLTKTTGYNMAETIKSKLADLGLDINDLRGQGYDGAAAMSGEFNGVQALIRSVVNSALYVHCANHCLNLTLSAASEINFIRNATGVVQSIYNFFNTPKKQNCLNSHTLDVETKTKLINFNPTRWIERHTSISKFLDLQKSIISALQEISSEWTDRTASSTAAQLLKSIKASDFNVTVRILNEILAFTLPLSRLLQKDNIDLTEALSKTELVQSILKSIRKDATEKFSAIFNNVIVTASREI